MLTHRITRIYPLQLTLEAKESFSMQATSKPFVCVPILLVSIERILHAPKGLETPHFRIYPLDRVIKSRFSLEIHES